MELFCSKCGKGSPIMASVCQCSLENYMLHATFNNAMFDEKFLVVSRYENQSIYWHYSVGNGNVLQSVLPKNVFPIPMDEVETVRFPASLVV